MAAALGSPKVLAQAASSRERFKACYTPVLDGSSRCIVLVAPWVSDRRAGLKAVREESG